MALSRTPSKAERFTITLVPERGEEAVFEIPSTFNRVDRTYGWKHTARMDYMIVPKRIASNEVKVEVFVTPGKGTRLAPHGLQKLVEELVQQKLVTEWKGLRLSGVGRPKSAAPPTTVFVRGTIEDVLGVPFKR